MDLNKYRVGGVSHLKVREMFNFSQQTFIECLLLMKHWARYFREKKKDERETKSKLYERE